MRMIEKKLKEKKLTMYRLAQMIGESNERTRYIVKHKDFTSDYRMLQRIAKALDCTIEDLLEDGE